MIICLFIYSILNYFTCNETLPLWVRGIFYVIQFFCVLIATGIWCKWKSEVEELKRELSRKNKNTNKKG